MPQKNVKARAEQIDSNLKALEVKEKNNEIQIRKVLSVGFVIIYGLFLASIIGFWFYDLMHPVEGRIQNMKDMIVTIYGLISAPFGVIVGFYFGNEKNKSG